MQKLRQVLQQTGIILSLLLLVGQGVASASFKSDVITPWYVPTSIDGSCSLEPTAENVVAPAPVLKPGSKVYMLGDSITNGAAAKYRAAFAAESVNITPFINANGGRAWKYAGSSAAGAYTPESGGASSGKTAVKNDAGQIAAANGIIIALGSNDSLTANPINEIISAIREVNQTAPIWWVNIVASHTRTVKVAVNYGPFNTALDGQKPLINVLDWHSTVIPGSNVGDIPNEETKDPNGYLSSDGLHPTSKGQDALVSLVIAGVTAGNAAPTPAAGCSCSTGTPTTTTNTPSENYKGGWDYFTGNKQLSPEAAAALMGNIDAESGFDPHNTQNNAVSPSGSPVPDGPEIPIDLIRNRYGYGLLQWTSAGRQQHLVDFANGPPKRSTGDLGLQLDFIWEELTASYKGVITKLQTPGISLDAATDEVTLHFVTPGNVIPPSSEATKQGELKSRRDRAAKIFNTYSGQPAGTYSGSAGCVGDGTGGTVIDVNTPDTTAIQCAAGTATIDDAAKAYNDGKQRLIRTCNVNGIQINSQISGPIKALIEAAAKDGLTLTSPGGGFRTMDGQIGVYNKWCDAAFKRPTPPPYPKDKWSDYVRCPGGAPPGFSNHQMGLAIDWVCNGSGIPMSYTGAKDNACFRWLVNNAGKYGLYEYGNGQSRGDAGYEGWHWSVDGT